MTYDPNQGAYPPGNYPPGGGPGGPGGPPSGGYPPPAGFGQGPSGPAQGRSFFGALFDYNFDSFATPSVIKVLYILGTVLLALFYLFAVIAGFSQSAVLGLLTLIGGALLAMVYLIFLRITLEFYYAVVRMSEDIHHRR